ncbi:hypothetical protein C2E23DRAFT_832622 [Lenzites betulinus]|nr:hypothetical protein C2E23DRAFT_832622 [Lenzites betulinus]
MRSLRATLTAVTGAEWVLWRTVQAFLFLGSCGFLWSNVFCYAFCFAASYVVRMTSFDSSTPTTASSWVCCCINISCVVKQ